jgi:hypothetical protein
VIFFDETAPGTKKKEKFNLLYIILDSHKYSQSD